MNVALVSHSLFMPICFWCSNPLSATRRMPTSKNSLPTCRRLGRGLREADSEIEMRLSRAITMLGNSRVDLRRHVSSLSSAP